jgi:glycosyltransferase involved in cell wall biosynthesis
MFGEGLEFLRQAKGKGLKICVDVFITPVAHRIIFEERKLFPEWEGEAIAWNSQLELRVAAILEMADLLICPGRNVVDGIAEFGMEVASKIRVVPYGSGTDFAGRLNEPIVGRVLFAGTAELRKGIHYFAAAAHELGTAGYDFRVAGGVTDRITKLPACDSLRFLGRISRSEMADEILTADVLVLPTLAEGSASVVSEALVAGLPVITTSSAGSSVIHDNSGLLVRERDCQDLASAINRVVSDRPFRRHLALGARSQARFLTEQEWEKRLIIALGEVTDRLEGK